MTDIFSLASIVLFGGFTIIAIGSFLGGWFLGRKAGREEE